MRFISTIILSFFFSVLFGQQINTEFGKNRIQFQEFEWIEHETDNFVFYWYGGGKAIGSYASILTEESYEEIKTILQYRIRTKIHVIVYNDLSDLKQSNIGNDPTFQNTGGVTKIEGNKMFVYFNGDHHDLKVQIRKGISKILVNNLLFGQNVREVVQNALLLDLPSWFLESAVEYIGEPWTIEKDNEFRKIIENEDVNSFSDALYQDGVLSGQALWNYIVKTNGTSAFANILYVTRTNRSLNQGFQYATSKTISKTSKEVFEYYKKGYTEDLENRQESPIALDINYKKRSDINRGALHPTLPIIAYSTNEEDQKKVFLYNYKTNKHSKVAKAGFKNPFQEIDFKYPLLDWSPSGEYLAIVFEKKDNLYLRIYDYRKKGTFDIKIENAFSRWLSIDFYDDNNIAVTADKKGQSDVFIYDLRNRKPRQLTSDLYDDKDATHVTIGDKKGIVFSSNRNTTSLEKKTLNEVYPILNQYDLYFLDLANNKKLYRLTNTPSVNETLPKSSGDSEILFLSDEVGIQNKFKGSINALEDDILFSSSQVTNFGYATDYFDYSPSTNISLDIGGNTKALQLFIDTLESAPHIGEKTFFLSSNEDVIELKESEEDIFFQKKKEPEPADSNKVFFYTPFDNDEDESVTAETEEVEEIELEAGEIETSGINNASSNEAFKKFKSGKTIAHRRKFRMVGLTTQLDNAPLVEGFTAFQASSFIPNESEFSANLALPITTLKFELDVRDLFEDYRINAGIRIPVNLGGIDYFVSFSDLRKRIDKKISLYRTKRSQNAFFEPGLPEDEIDVKYISTGGQFTLNYPFSIFSSLRFRTFARHDQTSFSNINEISIAQPRVEEGRFGGRLSYVFDNSIDRRINIWDGLKAKVFVETQQQIDLGTELESDFSLADNGLLGIVGFDVRKGIPVLKHSMFATRASGSTSFGGQQVSYFLGEVEGSLSRSFNDQIPANGNADDIAFQSFVGQMRGFENNIRNGNTFLVSNTEFRVPVVKYFTSKTLKSAVLNNLQVIGFFDIGSAFDGLDPTSDNSLNSDTFTFNDSFNTLSTIDVEFFRQPFVYSYGAGIRSTLFGYFLKLDLGWGIDSGDRLPARAHLSIGKDF